MEILDALLVLKEQAIEGCIAKPHYGICYNLSGVTGDFDLSYDFVGVNCSDWDFFSGCYLNPINNYLDKPLWEGEQLELRLSLIDHLITKAREQGV